YVDVVELGASITLLDVTLVEHAAAVLSFLIASRERASKVEALLAPDALRHILDAARRPDELLELAAAFDVDLRGPHVVGASVAVDAPQCRGSIEDRRAHVAEKIRSASGLSCRMTAT